jgi:hypothetical protein
MPADDEGRNDGLITTGRGAEEVDDRDLPLHGIPQPPIIWRVWIGAHERVIHDIIAGIDLAMNVALIVIPDPSAPSREHRLDAQEVFHLARLEDPALRIDQRNAVTAELETTREISGIEHSAPESGKPVHMIESRLAELGVLWDRYHPAACRKPYLWTHSHSGSKTRSPNPKADTSNDPLSV